ncbi:MAG: type VI immunity family protein [Myxococcota bacterium]
MSLLPLRHPPTGNTAARDGIVLVLFVRRSHVDLAAQAGDFFDALRAYIGEDTLNHIVAAEQWKPLTTRRFNSARKRMSAAAATGLPNEFVLMKGPGSEYEVGEYAFSYIGNEIGTEGNEERASSIEVWLPTEKAEERGLETFVEDILALAAHVPFSSGYCSMAINYEAADVAKVERQLTPALGLRHPGFDLHNTSVTQLQIGDHVRGAYWLTLLGPEVLEALGKDVDGLCEALEEPDITVHELDHGAAIVAGDELRPGDVNAGDRLPLTRKVAALLAPVTHTPTWGAIGFRVEDPMTRYLDWLRRHLD